MDNPETPARQSELESGLLETEGSTINQYGKKLTAKEVEKGAHREFVGGMWEKIGKWQFEYMVHMGLKPSMCLLDIGCGCLRGGVHFVRYLEPGNYFGVDANKSLLEAGYKKELVPLGLDSKLPRKNLHNDDRFRFSKFGVMFDYALAISLFTHLPLNHIRVCLAELAKFMKPGGIFISTFFECPKNRSIELEMVHDPGGTVTWADRDPYHYKVDDFLWCVKELPWEMNFLGDQGHPRAQKVLAFTIKTKTTL